MSAYRYFAKQRSGDRNLRHVADAKSCDPRFRLRKAFDEVWAPETDGNHGLPSLENLIGQRRLFPGNIDVALADANADKKSQDRNIVAVWRRQLQNVRVHEPRICSQCRKGV